MKPRCALTTALLSISLAVSCTAGEPAKTSDAIGPILKQAFDLAGKRSLKPHAYDVETNIVTYAEDGTQTSVEKYKLRLMCRPGNPSVGETAICTCIRVAVQKGDSAEVSVPAFEEWSYPFTMAHRSFDEQGQAYGIPHAKFEQRTDSRGERLPPEVAYQVYSLFLFFHDFTHGLTSGETREDSALRDLKTIGQQISVEDIAGSEFPLNFGSYCTEGSFKINGLTLQFKGVGLAGGTPCAILGFDSTGMLTMFLTPMPNVRAKAVGRSHMHGEVYLDLASKWEHHVSMLLTDIVKTAVGDQYVGNFVIETALTIRAVGKEVSEKK